MRIPWKAGTLVLVAFGLAGTSPSPSPPAAEKAVAKIATEFRTYRRITKKPVRVHPELSELCSMPSRTFAQDVVTRFGPHAHTALVIYMNDLAAEAFGAKAGTFPVGAVVVKQKTFLDEEGKELRGVSQRELGKGIGGMVKRAPGYDPDNGDWEYFYFERPTEIQSGHLVSCVECHAAAKGKDHVFGDWAAQVR